MLPFLLKPYLKNVLWGGSSISGFKGMDLALDHVGESWEVSSMKGCESVVASGPDAGKTLSEMCAAYGPEMLGKGVYEKFNGEFPLLIKYIDAEGDLSIQVHPGDDVARARHGCHGKAEMWYIVKAAPGAKMLLGFSSPIDKSEFERRAANGSIADVLAVHETSPGDVFFIPPGRVHAVGAGNFLVEVQVASDITYRIHDYNRLDKDGSPRQLHIAEAADAIDFSVPHDHVSRPAGDNLLKSPYFSVDKLVLGPGDSKTLEPEDFAVVLCLDGSAVAEAEGRKTEVGRGHTLFIPAGTRVDLSGQSTLLLVVP